MNEYAAVEACSSQKPALRRIHIGLVGLVRRYYCQFVEFLCARMWVTRTQICIDLARFALNLISVTYKGTIL